MTRKESMIREFFRERAEDRAQVKIRKRERDRVLAVVYTKFGRRYSLSREERLAYTQAENETMAEKIKNDRAERKARKQAQRSKASQAKHERGRRT
jgi:hypothetical protein